MIEGQGRGKKERDIYVVLTSCTVSQQKSLKDEQHNLQGAHAVQRQLHVPKVWKRCSSIDM